jgi:hypothetical protein
MSYVLFEKTYDNGKIKERKIYEFPNIEILEAEAFKDKLEKKFPDRVYTLKKLGVLEDSTIFTEQTMLETIGAPLLWPYRAIVKALEKKYKEDEEEGAKRIRY